MVRKATNQQTNSARHCVVRPDCNDKNGMMPSSWPVVLGDVSTVAAPTTNGDRLVGLVVKASASRAEDPGFESRDFFGVESYQ